MYLTIPGFTSAIGLLVILSTAMLHTDYYIDQNSGQFEVAGSVVFPGPEGIAVRKNDSSMFNAIQTVYKQLKAAGTYHQLILKWGLTNEELTAVGRRLNQAFYNLPAMVYLAENTSCLSC